MPGIAALASTIIIFYTVQVDSQGRPLADRSVIYKYLNPNLIAILSESLDKSVDRSSLLLYVVDAVTGQVLSYIKSAYFFSYSFFNYRYCIRLLGGSRKVKKLCDVSQRFFKTLFRLCHLNSI